LYNIGNRTGYLGDRDATCLPLNRRRYPTGVDEHQIAVLHDILDAADHIERPLNCIQDLGILGMGFVLTMDTSVIS